MYSASQLYPDRPTCIFFEQIARPLVRVLAEDGISWYWLPMLERSYEIVGLVF